MPIKTPNEISAAYYQFVDEFTQSDFEDEKLLGKFYTDCKNRPYNIVKIVDKPYMEAIIERDCEEITVPRFTWKDGSESIILPENGRTIVSMEEVSS